jgi:hypothetical protein
MSAESDAQAADTPKERRESPDRRRRLLHALFVGGLNPRRRSHRRTTEPHARVHDLHEARWLGIAMLIMLLSVADAILTVEVMHLGAIEVNPVMAVFLDGQSPAFAFVKVALTGFGVTVLTIMARIHAFGRVPVGFVLYAVLGLYSGLIAYEYWLLQALQREV